MTQSQYEQLLAWTMLSALNSAVLERQAVLGRDLTDHEYTDCHKTTHRNAELILNQLQLARASSGT